MTNPVIGSLCDGRDIVQADDHFGLVLDGMCGDVLISGSDGSVNLDGARSLRVTGHHVLALGKENLSVRVEGHDDTFDFSDIGALVVSGNASQVTGGAAKSHEMQGSGNTINIDTIDVTKNLGTGDEVVQLSGADGHAGARWRVSPRFDRTVVAFQVAACVENSGFSGGTECQISARRRSGLLRGEACIQALGRSACVITTCIAIDQRRRIGVR